MPTGVSPEDGSQPPPQQVLALLYRNCHCLLQKCIFIYISKYLHTMSDYFGFIKIHLIVVCFFVRLFVCLSSSCLLKVLLDYLKLNLVM